MTIRSKFYAHIAKTSPFSLGLEISKADSVYLYDETGKRYFDFISGIGVSNLGHGHPAIKNAIHHQVEDYMHTMVYGEHIHSPQVLLSEKLLQNLPVSFNQIYFLNSGAEAIDCAIKTARKRTQKQKIYTFKNAYHGSTYGAMSLMSDISKISPYGGGISDIHHFNFNDEEILEKIETSTAAVIMEVVQAEAGIKLPQPFFLKALAQKCSETGTLLIFDEIQTGMGRTGSLFAFEQYGVVPDVLVLGKGLGGGLPLSAVISSEKILSSIADNPPLTHMSTFGGHPVCCAAGLASLNQLLTTNIIAESRIKSNIFIEKIKHHPLIKEIRNTSGLWMAIDLGKAKLIHEVIPIAQEKGLLIDWFLFNDQSLRIAPPLIISSEELNEAADILLHSFDQLK